MSPPYHAAILLCLGVLTPLEPGVLAAQAASQRPARLAPRTGAPSARVARLLRTLTVRQKVGQVVMPWIPGSYAAFDDRALDQVRVWLDTLQVGGLIVSIGSPLDIAAKLNFLQRRSRLPLLVASDLEGGTAIRFIGGTPFPTNMGVGAAGSERDAYQMGRITAREGRSAGVHLTFSPVADINSNPANPIINTRSFGAHPEAVARLVEAAVRGTQDAGMLATVKHFPGHGDTETDSHLALPMIGADYRRLDTLELVPFRAAIRAGVAVVMSAHIALPAVGSDSLRPATLDPALLTGILRDSLGFRGMIVTDALDMGALITTWGAGEAAVQAFLAGSDLLLQPADPRAAVEGMLQALRDGRVSRRRLDQSVRRVLEAKERLGLFGRRTVNLDSLGYVVGRRASRDSARAVAGRAIVLVRDSLGVVDSLRAGPRPLALVTYGEANWASVGAILAGELRRKGHGLTTFRLSPASGPASYDSATAVIDQAPMVMFAVAVRATAGRGSIGMPDALAGLIERSAGQRPTILASFGSPYLLSQTPSVGSYLLGWISTPPSEEAVAAALSGASITGKLPIELPPWYAIGAGLERPAR